MGSPVKVLGVGIDTLVVNVLPTDTNFTVVKRRVEEELQAELMLLKQRAQDEEEDIPTRLVFHGANLQMRTKGSEGFHWILCNDWLTLAVNRGSKMGLLAQVRCASQYLWCVRDAWGQQDVGKIIAEVHSFLISLFGEYLLLQLSGCDLAVDVVNLDLGTMHEIKERFLTRAQLDDQMPLDVDEDGMIDGPDSIKRRWRRITGLPFGARNGAVSALLYDKTHEIKYKSPGKTWFHDLWLSKVDEHGQPLWDGESPVWRIEVRFKRRALHELKQEGVFHGIEEVYDLEERLPGLWAYAVGHVGGGLDGLPDGWLRYVEPSEGDTNRSRWPVHADWEVIQGALAPVLLPENAYEREAQEREDLLQAVDEELVARPFRSPVEKVKRSRRGSSAVAASVPSVAASVDLVPFVRKRHYEVNMRRMVAQIAGCAITAEAWRLCPEEETGEVVEHDISETFHFLFDHVQAYLEEQERDFSHLVHKKRVLYGTEMMAA